MIPELQIIWIGDLDDDCSAKWNGLILRAELMDENKWWWAVSKDNKNPLDQIDSSNNYDFICKGGEEARHMAEKAAVEYFEVHGTLPTTGRVESKPGCVLYIAALVFVIFLVLFIVVLYFSNIFDEFSRQR